MTGKAYDHHSLDSDRKCNRCDYHIHRERYNVHKIGLAALQNRFYKNQNGCIQTEISMDAYFTQFHSKRRPFHRDTAHNKVNYY